MSRRIKRAQIHTIRSLHETGHSNRAISRMTGIHRERVGTYVSEADSKPAKPDHPVGSGPANACEPFRERIMALLEAGLSGTRIFQELCNEHVFTASDSSVRRFIQRLGRTTPLPFLRVETAPGEEAQVDSGTGA